MLVLVSVSRYALIVPIILQFVSDSSISLDMYPKESDSPISPAGKGAGAKDESTPKGAKTKGGEENAADIGESPGLLQPVTAVRDEDAYRSVKKYIAPTLKGFSPKDQIEVDEALIQQSAVEGTHYM